MKNKTYKTARGILIMFLLASFLAIFMNCGGSGNDGNINPLLHIVNLGEQLKNIHLTAGEQTEISFVYTLNYTAKPFDEITVNLQESLDSVDFSVAGISAQRAARLLMATNATSSGQFYARIGAASEIDTVCQTGILYGPFTVTESAEDQNLSVEPETATADPPTVGLVNGGSVAVCLQMTAQVDVELNINQVKVPRKLCDEEPADFLGNWIGTRFCNNVQCPDIPKQFTSLTITKDDFGYHFSQQNSDFSGYVCGNRFEFSGDGEEGSENGSFTLNEDNTGTKTTQWLSADNTCSGTCVDALEPAADSYGINGCPTEDSDGNGFSEVTLGTILELSAYAVSEPNPDQNQDIGEPFDSDVSLTWSTTNPMSRFENGTSQPTGCIETSSTLENNGSDSVMVRPILSGDDSNIVEVNYQAIKNSLLLGEGKCVFEIVPNPVDTDNDGIPDNEDICPAAGDSMQCDGDGDGVGDICDNCPQAENLDQADTDGDSIGDACDQDTCVTDPDCDDGNACTTDSCEQSACVYTAVDDTDNDSLCDAVDNCPNTVNSDQTDSDGDLVGNACETCPDDPEKTEPGTCGCGNADIDDNDNGIIDCIEACQGVNVEGVWSLLVQDITSSCGSGLDYWTSTIQIQQNGCSLETYGIKDTSFLITGTVAGNTVTIGPADFAEDGGITTATYTMTLTSDTSMSGNESWTWSGLGSSCTNGNADLTATKID